MDTIFGAIDHYEGQINGVFKPISTIVNIPVGELVRLTGIDY